MENKKTMKKHTTVYLDPKIANALTNICKDEDRSLTKQIERILKDWLIEHGHLKKQKT